MGYNATILLGRISKIHGFEGAVTVKLERTFVEKIPEMESVFIEFEGKPVPFFIEDHEYRGGDILRLKFSGYDSFDRVREFAGCRIFLTSGKAPGKEKDTGSIKGFKIMLSDGTLTGTITRIIENPGQLLLELSAADNKAILIPFHDDLIISTDIKKKIIVMDLPEGLTEIN
ncbi:MAG: 16S rRNA processing protein RimM [Bacteroidales bacterium]|nr:16S rRNA processing protein RimM [Bacteroidales bacterium]